MSKPAQEILDMVNKTDCGLYFKKATDSIGITSQRKKQDILEELRRSASVRIEKMKGRGEPTFLIPVHGIKSGLNMDETDEITTTD